MDVELLDVPRSSFYQWRQQAARETTTQARRRVLAEEVQRVFDQCRQTAGCRRIAAQLNEEASVQRGVGRRPDAPADW